MKIKKVKEFIFHSVNGVRSGIPLCCIKFFVTRNWKNDNSIARNVDKERGISWTKIRSCNYVQCDKCYKKNKIVEVKQNGTIFAALLK